MTKWHPAYHSFAPVVETWTPVPQVMAYVRRDRRNLRAEQALLTSPSRDLLALNIFLPGDNLSFRAINLYNAPPGAVDALQGLQHLFANETPTAISKMVIIGDFNLYHEKWKITRTAAYPSQAYVWASWAEARNLALLIFFNIPTHINGGTIDLAWATPSLLSTFPAQTTIAEDLATPSNHVSLQTTLYGGHSALYRTPGRFGIIAQIKLVCFKL